MKALINSNSAAIINPITLFVLFIGSLCIAIGIAIPQLGLQAVDLLTLGVLVLLVPMLVMITKSVWSVRHYYFHPLFFILLPFGIGYVVRSFYIIFVDRTLMVGFSDDALSNYLFSALLLVYLGTVCLWLGYCAPTGRAIAQRMPVFRSTFSMNRLGVIVLLTYLIAIGSSFIILRGSGFGLSLVSFTVKKRDIPTVWLLVSSQFTVIAICLHYIYISSKGYWSIYSVLPWIAGTFFGLFMGAYTSSRTVILTIVVVALVLYNHRTHQLTKKQIAFAIGGLLLFSSSLVGIRNMGSNAVERLQQNIQVTEMITTLVASRDLADITTLAHIIRYIDITEDLRLGETMAGLFTRFIPRSLWPDKPLNLGVEVSDLFYDQPLNRGGDTGVPPSLLAELFWNFHLPGVIAGMFIFGIFARWAYEYLWHNPLNPWTITIYGLSVMYIWDQARANVSLALGRYLMIMIPLLCAIAIVTWSRRTCFEKPTNRFYPMRRAQSDMGSTN